MIEIHTKITCKVCGESFHAMYASTLPLPSDLEQEVVCPFCKCRNKYAYHFEADFSHRDKWKEKIRFWQKHYIASHFTANEGSHDEEVYPRKCVCGKNILIKQKRIPTY